MDNVNCAAFRLLCKENGAGLVSTPMINTNAFIQNRERFYWYNEERPLLVQFIGNNPDEFKECVQNISNCDVVDLNAGCPSNDQTRNNSGSALLKDLPRFEKILKTMVKYSPVPVSVKVRMGWDKNDALKIAKIAERVEVEFITIHPRTRFENYGTPARWNVIRDVKRKVKIPVIASGDLTSPENIKRCLETTGADGVMVARGAINNPFIFNDTLALLKGKEIKKHGPNDIKRIILRFIELYKKYDRYELSELRNHCIWLVNGIKGARSIRDRIGRSQSEEEIINIVNSIE